MALDHNIPDRSPAVGSRRSSPETRRASQCAERFTGLSEGVNRYDLLNAAKRCGRAAGFTPILCQFLEYLINHTYDQDWESGTRPIVYKSVTRMARDFGITERQVRNWERRLFQLGVLAWNDSANHRRTGLRDQSGRLIFAYGIDLSPLASRHDELVQLCEEIEAHEARWRQVKLAIGHERREIRALLSEASADSGRRAAALGHQSRFEALTTPIRAATPLAFLEELLPALKALRAELEELLIETADSKNFAKTSKISSRAAQNYPHSNTTTTQQFRRKSNSSNSCSAGKSERRLTPCQAFKPSPGMIRGSGIEHITLRQVLTIGSKRFAENLQAITSNPYGWNDVIEAAHWLRQPLGINQSAWAEACVTMGRPAAAVCVVLADRGATREDNPVESPGGYLRALTDRARAGELHLHRSVFGWLQKDFADG